MPAAEAPLIAAAVRGRRSAWLRRLTTFAAIVLLADALFGERGLAETLRARERYEAASAELRRVRSENGRLRERVRRLREDPPTIEAEARRELGWIKPGELLFVVRPAGRR